MVCEQESKQQQKLKASTPHVVCLGYPFQGHIKPMMQLCELLALSKGATVTFVTTDFHIKRMKEAKINDTNCNSNSGSANSTYISHDSNNYNSHVRLVGIRPDIALLPDDFYTDSSLHGEQRRLLAYDQNLQLPFFRFIQEATEAVSLIIFDAFLSWACDVGSKLGIHTAALWTSGTSSLVPCCYIPLLLSQGVLPIKGSNDKAALETRLTCAIPGLPPIFKVKDLPPSFLVEDPCSNVMFQIISRRLGALRDAKCPVLINSVPELDAALEDVQGLPKMVHVGPIFALGRGPRNTGSLWSEAQASTWQVWLGARAAGSVMFVSFGSLAVLTPSQARGIVMGLLESGRPFLWACRPGLVEPTTMDEIQRHVSSGRANQRCLVVPWVAQAQVLAHPAVGAFLTHCGWNSVLEAMWAGVPMLGFPQLAEQRMNCRMVEHVWRVGAELQLVDASDDDRGSSAAKHVASGVASLFDGHVADELRERCAYWRRTIRKAARSSLNNVYGLQ